MNLYVAKGLHVFIGAVVGNICGIVNWQFGIIMSVLAGVAKEVYDDTVETESMTSHALDVLYTSVGGVIGVLIAVYWRF